MNKTEIPVKTALLLKLLDLGNNIKELDINYKPVNKKATEEYMKDVRDIAISIVTFIDEVSGIEENASVKELLERIAKEDSALYMKYVTSEMFINHT